MKKHIALAFLILLASCGAGAIARSVWYNQRTGYPAMTWVKDGASDTLVPIRPRPKPPKHDQNENANVAKVAVEDPGTADPAEVTKPDAPPANPCECDHKIEGFCVARIDCVLQHLGDRTAYIIDAREDGDFNEAHLMGAIHLPSSAIYDNIQNVMAVVPGKQDLIIVYCGGGHCEASKNVGLVLREFDYRNVWLYEQGWEEVESSNRFGDFIEIGG
jgi:rhodanese-related sulfurtransferase